MTNFATALASGIRSAVCTYLSASNNYFYAIRNISPGSFFPWATSGAAYRLLCNREPPPEVAPTPPYNGGQCPGVSYHVIGDVTWNPSPPSGTPYNYSPSGDFNGPITFAGARRSSANNVGFVVDHAGGTAVLDGLAAGADVVATYQVNNVRVTRNDGLPDNCGDPEPDPVPPPDSSITNVNIDYDDDDGTSISVPIALVFAPIFVNASAELNIPVRLSFDPTFNNSFNATVNLNTGDITYDFSNTNVSGGGNNSSPSPDSYNDDGSDPGTPPDVPTPDLPPPPDEAEDEREGILRGVIVTATLVPDHLTEIFQDDNPNIFIPRLGNVQFCYRIGNKLAWSEDIPVRNKRQFIPCPWEGGAIDVKGTPTTGVEISLTKVYTSQSAPVQFLL